MLEKLLPSVPYSKHYNAAMTIYDADSPITEDIIRSIFSIYSNYAANIIGDEVTPIITDANCRVMLAFDITTIRGFDIATLRSIGLNESEIAAIDFIYQALDGQFPMTSKNISTVKNAISNLEINEIIRLIMARIALDIMINDENFKDIQRDIREIAAFIRSVGTEASDKCIAIMSGIRKGADKNGGGS